MVFSWYESFTIPHSSSSLTHRLCTFGVDLHGTASRKMMSDTVYGSPFARLIAVKNFVTYYFTSTPHCRTDLSNFECQNCWTFDQS